MTIPVSAGAPALPELQHHQHVSSSNNQKSSSSIEIPSFSITIVNHRVSIFVQQFLAGGSCDQRHRKVTWVVELRSRYLQPILELILNTDLSLENVTTFVLPFGLVLDLLRVWHWHDCIPRWHGIQVGLLVSTFIWNHMYLFFLIQHYVLKIIYIVAYGFILFIFVMCNSFGMNMTEFIHYIVCGCLCSQCLAIINNIGINILLQII